MGDLNIALPETNSSPPKMVAWKTTFLLGWPIFRAMLVSGRESIQLVIEPTHLKKYAQVKLDHFPKNRGDKNQKNVNEKPQPTVPARNKHKLPYWELTF